jgi:hypothetical protein
VPNRSARLNACLGTLEALIRSGVPDAVYSLRGLSTPSQMVNRTRATASMLYTLCAMGWRTWPLVARA